MSSLTVQLPDHIIAALATLDCPPEDIIIQALETYLKTHTVSPGKSRTWELCGKFDLAAHESSTSELPTNYAENIDAVLYDSLTES
jgi:hypothetical protein